MPNFKPVQFFEYSSYAADFMFKIIFIIYFMTLLVALTPIGRKVT